MLHYKTYELGPQKDWVIFIHGAGGSSSIWFNQIRTFRKVFNVLLVDLRGHGKSQNLANHFKRYTFKQISQDVIEVLDHLKIRTAHFVGISLGTVIIRTIGELAPDRIQSMILGGAITRLTFRSKILVVFGNCFKWILPYLWLYKLLAWIIMPKKRHERSRLMFINEAAKLCQKEFMRWFKLTKDVIPLLNYFEEKEIPVPTLYLMGEEDHMFLTPVENLIKQHRYSTLRIIEKSGHACNVDRPDLFNQFSISFINNHLTLQNAVN